MLLIDIGRLEDTLGRLRKSFNVLGDEAGKGLVDRIKVESEKMRADIQRMTDGDLQKIQAIQDGLDPSRKIWRERDQLREMLKRGAFDGQMDVFYKECERLRGELSKLKGGGLGRDFRIENPSRCDRLA